MKRSVVFSTKRHSFFILSTIYFYIGKFQVKGVVIKPYRE